MLALGVVVALFGLTFTLQGIGLVGPVGGLMYDNPVWVTQGSAICILGLVIVVAALAINREQKTTV